MATLEDLKDVMSSVEEYAKEQSSTLNELLDVQNKIYDSQQREYEKNKVGRDTPLPPAGDTDDDNGPSDNSKPEFDFSSLGKLQLLVQGLAVGVGVTIGVLQGQLKAIQTFFKGFAPNLFDTFNNFKTSLTARIVDLLEDLKIRTAFIKVSIGEFLTNTTNSIKNLFAIDESSTIGKIASTLRTSISNLVAPFRIMIETITGLVSGPDGPVSILRRTFDGIRSLLGSLGSSIGKVSSIVGKLFAPIAIIMTVFDTIKGALDGYAEGGILGGIRGAIDGFFTSLVTVPLDLLKDITAWVLGKLGFDETSEAVSSFSFTELWKDMTGAIFGGIESAIDWIKTLFSDPVDALTQLWTGLYGEGGIVDMMYYPVNLAIDWITKKFGWREEDAPTFSIMGFFGDVFNILKEKFVSFGEYLTTLPERLSIEAQSMWINVKEKLQLGFLDLAAWISNLPAKILASIINILDAAAFTIPDNKATRFFGIDGAKIGFVDEDVVEAANAAAESVDPAVAERRAEITGNAFIERSILDDRLKRLEDADTVDPAITERKAEITGNALIERSILDDRLKRLEEQAIQSAITTNVVIAPTDNRQTNISSNGGDSITQTSINASRSDLDYLGNRAVQ